MTKFILWKSDKNNLRVMPLQYAHLQTMIYTSVKFQRNQHKTVGGDAYTRYQVSIHFGRKNDSSFCEKSDSKKIFEKAGDNKKLTFLHRLLTASGFRVFSLFFRPKRVFVK